MRGLINNGRRKHRLTLHGRPMLAPRAALFVTLTCALLGSCAVFEEENRVTLNAIDTHLTPDSSAARWAVAPLVVPVGLVGAAADIVFVHPVLVIDDAWGDTVDLLWTPGSESRFRRAVMLPLVVVATPFVFLGDWLWRAAWAVSPREEQGAS